MQRRVIPDASDPRVETRGYRYYTPTGYGTEIPTAGKYRAHLVNPPEKKKKRLNFPTRQRLPDRPWVVPGNNASDMER